MQEKEKNDECGSQPKRSFRQLLVDFSNKASLSSISFIKAPCPWPVKIIWTLLTLAAFGASIFHIHLLYDYFSGWPKQTELTLSYNPLPLPSITICNTNPVRKSLLNIMPDYVKTAIDDRNPEKSLSKSSYRRKRSTEERNTYTRAFVTSDQNKNDSTLGEIEEKSQKEMSYDFSFCSVSRDLRIKSGHQMEDMLLECSFRGRTCNASIFSLTQNKDYGNCYTLSRNEFIVQKSGPSEGVTLTLLLETYEYLPMTEGYGARIQIHDQGTAPLPTEEGFFVSANTETNIGLYMLNISRLGYPYGQCEEGDDFMAHHGLKYGRQVCRKMCELKQQMNKCGCFDSRNEELSMRIDRNATPCKNETEIQCFLSLDYNMRSESEICGACISPCQETAYQKSLSSRMWPTVTYMTHLIHHVCEKDRGAPACSNLTSQMRAYNISDLGQNFIKLNIYYEDLNYQVVKESQSYQDVEFFSDMGGAIGLWIGLSVLSLCEVGHLLIEVTMAVWSKCVRTKK